MDELEPGTHASPHRPGAAPAAADLLAPALARSLKPSKPKSGIRVIRHRKARLPDDEASPYDLVEGDVDPGTGYEIGHLIGAYKTCIVYLDTRGYLHYRCTSDHEWQDEAAFAQIEIEVNHLIRVASRSATIMLGEALALALESGDFAGAKSALILARGVLAQEQRMRVVLTTLALVAVALLGIVSLVTLPARLGYIISPVIARGSFCALAGGIGACLSIMQRTGELPLPAVSQPIADVMECVIRFVIGTFAATILYLAICADLLLGIVTRMGKVDDGSQLALLLGFSLAAGASERVFPKLIRSFEQQIH